MVPSASSRRSVRLISCTDRSARSRSICKHYRFNVDSSYEEGRLGGSGPQNTLEFRVCNLSLVVIRGTGVHCHCSPFPCHLLTRKGDPHSFLPPTTLILSCEMVKNEGKCTGELFMNACNANVRKHVVACEWTAWIPRIGRGSGPAQLPNFSPSRL